jgi:hypothetical protein
MISLDLVGRCGLYCGHCSIHRAYKDSRKLQEEIAKRYGCLPEDVVCDGCQAVDGYCWCIESKWGSNCKIAKCLETKNLKYCHECLEYPQCTSFNEFAEDNLKNIGVDVRENLRKIKEEKIENWLSEQDKKWRCRNCGKPSINSVEVDRCHWCGANLR